MKNRKYNIYHFILSISCVIVFTACKNNNQNTETTHSKPNEISAKGWNTWDTHSVLSYVLLPEGLALNLLLVDGKTGDTLRNPLIGRRGENTETIKAGAHAYDGSYTQLEIEWRGTRLDITSATKNDELYLSITPIVFDKDVSLVLSPEFIWENKGQISIEKDRIVARANDKEYAFSVFQDNLKLTENKLTLALDKPIFIAQNKAAETAEIKAVIQASAETLKSHQQQYNTVTNEYDAMQSVLAWDVIYELSLKRVITPVSRLWNTRWAKGWVLFDWDTYFASYMLALDNKELAKQ